MSGYVGKHRRRDPALAQYAADSRQLALQVLAWDLDRLRLRWGQVIPVEPGTPGSRMVLCHGGCRPDGVSHFHAIVDREV